MSVLVDKDIRELSHYDGSPLIEPYRDDQCQPASYDVRLGRVFQTIGRSRLMPVDTADPSTFENLYERVELEDGGRYSLHPGGFVLGCTEERVCVPAEIVGRIEGKSSLARLGIIIESAGFLDPGFEGRVTLEIYNQLPVSIILYAGMQIAQLSFELTTVRPERLYGDPTLNSHYQNDDEAVGSRYGS